MLLSLAFCTFVIHIANANKTTTEHVSENTFDQPLQFPFDFTLRKCSCEVSHELQGSKCVDAQTYLSIVDIELGKEYRFSTANFSNVIVSGINCAPGFVSGTLLNYIDGLYLLSNGAIFWQNGNKFFENYCIENIPGGWVTQVCLEPPVVPRCCPSGYVLGPENSCSKSSLVEAFAPPVKLNDEILNIVEITHEYVSKVDCREFEVEHSVTLGTEEGSLLYGPTQTLLTYKPQNDASSQIPVETFCVGVEEFVGNGLQYIAKFCYKDLRKEHHHLCKNVTCVRKCCPSRKFELDGECLDLHEAEEEWQPIFHEEGSLTPGDDGPKDLYIISGLPICEKFYELAPHEIESDKTYLLKDGTLHWPNHRDIASDSYCIDNTILRDGNMSETVVICEDSSCVWKGTLTIVLLSISCVFLIGTLAVYLGVSDLRDRTNGRCLVSLVVAMLAAFISILANTRHRNPTAGQCAVRGFFGHFSSLAMFFWLNVLCYDMWATLRSSQHQHQSKKTFIKYSIYAWVTPLLIAIIALIMEFVQPENVIPPNFRLHKTCWFAGDAEHWLYMSGFILLLGLVNLFFFAHVAITLARKLQQRQSVFDTNSSRSSNSNKTKKQVWLYVKLFIVMGVSWFADVVSRISHRNTCSYWIIFEIINGLQGVFIFLVAVCNKDNMKKFRKAWNPRVESVRSKISTIRGKSPASGRRRTDCSLAASEYSRKTSVTSLPRKISCSSGPPLQSLNVRHSNTPPPRKLSGASCHESIPMNPIEE